MKNAPIPSTLLNAMIATLGMLASPVPALAQDGEIADGDSAGGEDSSEADASEDSAPVAPSAVEETVYVVQGKRYLVAGNFEISPQFAQSVNDQFTSHTGLLLSGIYHLKENVAFEVAGGIFGWWDAAGPRLGGRDSDLTVELRDRESLAPERVKLYQFPWMVAADAQWSPFYGKVSFQDVALAQFNLYLSVGAGVFGLQLESLTRVGDRAPPVELPPTFGSLPPMALSTTFGGGLRFYFADWLGVRLEVRDYVIPLAVRQPSEGSPGVADADGPTFDVTNLVLAQLGVSFVF